MRILLLALVCVPAIGLVGCGPSKPDPRDRPDFVDTSDPGKVNLYSADDFKRNSKAPRKP